MTHSVIFATKISALAAQTLPAQSQQLQVHSQQQKAQQLNSLAQFQASIKHGANNTAIFHTTSQMAQIQFLHTVQVALKLK